MNYVNVYREFYISKKSCKWNRSEVYCSKYWYFLSNYGLYFGIVRFSIFVFKGFIKVSIYMFRIKSILNLVLKVIFGS